MTNLLTAKENAYLDNENAEYDEAMDNEINRKLNIMNAEQDKETKRLFAECDAVNTRIATAQKPSLLYKVLVGVKVLIVFWALKGMLGGNDKK